MSDLRRYGTYAAKGLLSVPLVLAAGAALARYRDAVDDPAAFADPERFPEIDRAAGNAFEPLALFAALWGKRPK